MLTLKNVSAGYSGESSKRTCARLLLGSDVIKDISFSLNGNENLSIIGPNGCGKTTLLKTIANILDFRGEIEIGGQSVRGLRQKEISLKVAMLSQMSGIYFSYSVFDTVMMGRYPHIKDRLFGLPSEDDKMYVMRCLEAVHMVDEKDRDITKLSGGQLQRVFLARTLAQDPEIILLDEPTNHLDLKYQVELIDYLKKWAAAEKRAVIGVLHDINLALRLSDNIMVMKDGESKAFGKAGEVITDRLLENVYGIDVSAYMRESLKKWEGVRK